MDILGNLRRFKGQVSLLVSGRKKIGADLGEVEKSTTREAAAKMTSGREAGFFKRWWCGGGGGGGGISNPVSQAAQARDSFSIGEKINCAVPIDENK